MYLIMRVKKVRVKNFSVGKKKKFVSLKVLQPKKG